MTIESLIAEWRKPFYASSYEQNQAEVDVANYWRNKCADDLEREVTRAQSNPDSATSGAE